MTTLTASFLNSHTNNERTQHGVRFFNTNTNTQKQNKMIHTEFKTQLQILGRDIQKDEEKLAENFLYYFAWVGEDLWKMKYKQQFIQRIYEAALEREDLDEIFEDALKAEIKPRLDMLREQCLKSYNVRDNSTGALHRETSLWKFQAELELIDWLKHFENKKYKNTTCTN